MAATMQLQQQQSARRVVSHSARVHRAVMVHASAKPAVMVNSCTGKMGRAVAEAAVRAGLDLVPYTLCGATEVAANKAVEVAGKQLELVGPDTRDNLIEEVGLLPYMKEEMIPDALQLTSQQRCSQQREIHQLRHERVVWPLASWLAMKKCLEQTISAHFTPTYVLKKCCSCCA